MGKLSVPPCDGTTWSSPLPNERSRFSSSRSSWLRSRRADAVSALPELDIRGILGELVREGVDFLVIGGVAVGYHGHIRATKDVDVVPAPDRDNLERLTLVLRDLEARIEGAEDFESGELPDPLDPEALALGGNWVLQTRLGRLDIMQWIGNDALWDKLAPAAIDDEVGGIPIKMVSYEDLVALKEQASRPEDLMDLERLRQARGEESAQ
jgi:predicted nucleotidyltransferase